MKHLLQPDQVNNMSYLAFRLQLAILIIIVCFTGARIGSLVSDAKVKGTECLKWKVKLLFIFADLIIDF